MLSMEGSTLPLCTFAARSDSDATISFWISDGCTTTVSKSASGTGRSSWSLVLISATSLNMDISSGRLKNFAKRVRAR